MTQKELDIIGHQSVPFDEVQNIIHIFNSEDYDVTFGIIEVYLYGVIQGKRQERIRRKKSTDKSKYML